MPSGWSGNGAFARCRRKKGYSIDPRDGWMLLAMLKGVQPGGATDFSGWKLQDALAGERVKFYGVNLVGSACWPTKEQTDEIVARLVRSGYNAVRLHHIENRGGIIFGTDGAWRGEVPVAYVDGRICFTAATAREPADATLLYELVR